MCGIAGAFGPSASPTLVESMVAYQRHRGPDAQWVLDDGRDGIGCDRLRVIDPTTDADRPLVGPGGMRMTFNGEVYNHLALRHAIGRAFPWQTHTDTEVVLAAFERWGTGALSRLLGMFAVAFWVPEDRRVLAARDRFGVKPLYYHHSNDGTLLLASEIGALHAAGVPAVADPATWAAYLTTGQHEQGEATFWTGIRQVPAGHHLEWHDGHLTVTRWYDLPAEVGEREDRRPETTVLEEYRALLIDSVRLRLAADVPLGVNLSGGVDSATLLAVLESVGGDDICSSSYTFATGDERYDEVPWVERLVGRRSPTRIVRIDPAEVPDLAASVAAAQDEPYGGLATLAYARLFEQARADGTVVLLDGQGMDEQWAGYDYYLNLENGSNTGPTATIQGIRSAAVRPDAVLQDLARAVTTPASAPMSADPVRAVQYRDILVTKLPRALRFNDRVSMRASTELREPFLDHRLVELALRQPAHRKVRDGTTKFLLRRLAADLLPAGVATTPKRPVQTPQREWLRGPLRPWAEEQIAVALQAVGGTWLDPEKVHEHWAAFVAGRGDNAFFAWQWISIGLVAGCHPQAFGGSAR